MPILRHPREGVMNHQPEGPTCFMSCAIAVREYFNNALVISPAGGSPVTEAYQAFIRDHADGVPPKDHLKRVLEMGGYYQDEKPLSSADTEENIFNNYIAPQIDAGNPVLCGVKKRGKLMGHVFLIYGYDDINNIYTADPIIGLRIISMAEIKRGYNGGPAYRWKKLLFTRG